MNVAIQGSQSQYATGDVVIHVLILNKPALANLLVALAE